MAWQSETWAVENASGTTCDITVPVGGYSVGHLLVLGIMIPGSISPTMTVSDPGSNTWNTDQDIAAGTSGPTYQLSCVVTTALDSGDTITVTSSQTVVHFACVLEEFNDIMTGTDVGATGNSGGSADATPSTSSTATTAQPNELLVGVMGLVSPLRVYTPGSGFTVGSHINSTAASSDRGVVMQWKYLTATGTYVSNGTFNSASIYGATVQAYKITFPPVGWLTA